MTALDVRRLIGALLDHDVAFVVAGMGGAILQGAPGITRDLDVVVLLDIDNYEALADALNSLGSRRLRNPSIVDPIEERDFFGPGVKQFVTDAGPIDVMPELPGVGHYPTVHARARTIELSGRRVMAADLADIVTSKEQADRDKDRAVLPMLRATLVARGDAGSDAAS